MAVLEACQPPAQLWQVLAACAEVAVAVCMVLAVCMVQTTLLGPSLGLGSDRAGGGAGGLSAT